jgi:hypothetical protein
LHAGLRDAFTKTLSSEKFSMHGYWFTDTLGALEAAVLFIPFFLAPGFLLGNLSDELEFRGRSAAERFLLSLVLSASVSPVLAVLLVRFSSLTVAIALFLLAAAVSLALVLREFLGRGVKSWSLDRTTWIALGMMAIWVALALVSLVDWQKGDKLYITYAAYDHSIRVMMVDAVARTGVPPRNPLFYMSGAPVLRYYYYWYVLCAFPVHLAGISPRASFNGSVFWSGFALAALIPLYLKHFSCEQQRLRLKSLVGIGLLLVTGYDLFPFIWLSRRLGALWGDTEWWDTNQVASWIGSLIWVPHHVASLIACLVGFLLLIALPEDTSNRQRIWTALLAGAAFSSAAGLSIYVTFVFAVFIVVWVAIILVWKGPKTFFPYAVAGLFSLILALPYLNDLRGPSRAGSSFAFFAFRDYPVAQQWLRLQGVTDAVVLRFSRFPALFVVYFFEFGLYFLVGAYCLRTATRQRWRLSVRQYAGWLMFTICLLVVTFVSSDASGVNDLGFRGILVVQFVLLIWAAPLVSELFLPSGESQLGAEWKVAFALSVVVGVLGTLMQLGVLRAYAPVIDEGISLRTEPWMGPLPGLGMHTLRMRRSIEQLKAITPRNAVLQYNPVGPDLFLMHLYADRQAAVGDDSCGTSFGGDWKECQQVLPFIDAAFYQPEAARAWNMDQFCDSIGINTLVATSSDPVWADKASWVWTRPTLLATDSLRAMNCGTHPPEK